MATQDATSEFVRSLDYFKGFSEKEINVLLGVLRMQPLRDGQSLFRQGQVGNAVYFIVAGKIRVTIGAGEDEEDLATLGRGDLFGQVALVDGRRSANCTADGDTVVLALDRNEFDLLFNSGSTFAFKFLDIISRILVGQLRGANQRLAEVASREQAKEQPSLPSHPDVQDFLKSVALQTGTFKLEDFSLDEIQVVYSDADQARKDSHGNS